MESCICFILYIFRTTQFLWMLAPNSHTYSYSQKYGHLVDNTYLFLQFRTANHTSHSIKYFFKNVILIKIALGWIAKLFPCHWNLQYVFPFLEFGLVMWYVTYSDQWTINKHTNRRVLKSTYTLEFASVTLPPPCEKAQFSLLKGEGTFELK